MSSRGKQTAHKPWPDRDDGSQRNEPDTVRGTKQGMQEARQGGPLGGGGIQAKTQMSSSWPSEDVQGRAVQEEDTQRADPPPQEGEVWGVQEPERRLLGRRGRQREMGAAARRVLGGHGEDMDTLRGQPLERGPAGEEGQGQSEGSGWCPATVGTGRADSGCEL